MADDSISTCSQGSSCIVDDTFENRLVPLGKSGNELAQVDDPDIQHPVHQSPMNMQVTAENIDHVGTKINNITLVLKGSHVRAEHPDYLASVIKDNLEIIEAGGTKVRPNLTKWCILTFFVVLGLIVLFIVVCFVMLETLGNKDQIGQSNQTESVNQSVTTSSYPQKPTPQPISDSTTKRHYYYSSTYYSNPYPLTVQPISDSTIKRHYNYSSTYYSNPYPSTVQPNSDSTTKRHYDYSSTYYSNPYPYNTVTYKYTTTFAGNSKPVRYIPVNT
ncbi:hypothetical protein J6590_019843 [Homalodisca vitripennis]|nr:hypothetical protein J6590_019843 [Homalodisca vitripennis]